VTTCVDSSALVPVYVSERFSKGRPRCAAPGAASAVYRAALAGAPNAFALLKGRGLIGLDEHRAIRAQLQDDIDAQRLVPVALDWSGAFAIACELSDAHTAKLLTRSLDLLHVAAALATHCRVFVSADNRQLAVAKVAGLKTVDVKRSPRSPRR
jgi:predicted nucleic acid-binding protein